jgi:hypothetical protein
MNFRDTTEADLEDIDVVGLMVDQIACPISEECCIPADRFDPDHAFIDGGKDDDGEQIWIPNFAQQIDGFSELELKLRSRKDKPIAISALVYGFIDANRGVRSVIGTSPVRIEPGAIVTIVAVVEHGISGATLNLLASVC